MGNFFELSFKIWCRSFVITSVIIALGTLFNFEGGSGDGGAAIGMIFMCLVVNVMVCLISFFFSMFQTYRIEKNMFLKNRMYVKIGIYCLTAFIGPVLMFYTWQSEEELSFLLNIKYLLFENSIWSGLIWVYFLTVSYSIIYYKILEPITETETLTTV